MARRAASRACIETQTGRSTRRRENGIYYPLDTVTRKRNSLNITDREEARHFLNALNEACKQPAINLQIAQVYLQHSDPDFTKRT